MNRGLRILMFACAAILLTGVASAQKKKGEVCSVCEHDPEIMAAGGVINHGPFQFFRTDSEEVTTHLGASTLLWIETEHFRIGSDLKKWKIPVKDKKAYFAELTEFQKTFPAVDPKKTKTLDRWLRLHLMAWRMENLYDQTVKLWGWTEADFLKLPQEQVFLDAIEGEWVEDLQKADIEGERRTEGFPVWIGLGQFLGMPMKQEVLILRYREDMGTMKRDYIGHNNTHPQRWHITWRVDGSDPVSRTMWFGFATDAEGMKHDQHVHNALLHNVGINLLDSYMLYLVEAPIWLRTGWGHYLTQKNSIDYNFYDLDEGSSEQNQDEKHWKPAVRKLVVKDEAPGFSTLGRIRSFGDVSLDAHLVSWSKVCWLMETYPEGFAAWVLYLKTVPNHSNNLDVQRDAMKKSFGFGFPQAEAKWKEWVLATYPVKM